MNLIASALLVGALSFGIIPATTAASSDSIETLIAYLKSPNPNTRRDAAKELGKRRSRQQPVAQALADTARNDEDDWVRREAVRALGLIKEPSAVPDMTAVLKDTEVDVRREAVRALVSVYTEQNIDFITNRRTGWNMFNPFLDTSDREIIEQYVTVDPLIIEALGEAARGDHERDVRIAAIRALGVLRGRDAIPHLTDALNADEEVRIEVIRTFVKIGEPAAGRHLVRFFGDSNRRTRTQAMVAAGLLKYRDAVEPLMSIYGVGPKEKPLAVRASRKVQGLFSYLPPRDEAALWALALIGDDRAEQVFVENLEDKSDNRRQYAVEGLARIGDSRFRDQISRMILTEKDRDVRLAMHWALYRMGNGPHLHDVVRGLDSLNPAAAREYLLETTNPADLYPYIRTDNKTVQRQVIEILGHIGDRSTVSELEPIAKASGSKTSDVATVALKRIEWRLAGPPVAGDPGQQRPRRSNK